MDTGGDDGNEEQAKITVRLSLNSQVLKLSIKTLSTTILDKY